MCNTQKTMFTESVMKEIYRSHERIQESLREQASRVLVFESLLTAAVYMAWSTMLQIFKEQPVKINTFIVFITLLSVAILTVALLSLWKKTYHNFPSVKNFFEVLDQGRPMEELIDEYYKNVYSQVVDSLKASNKRVSRLINACHVLIMIQLGTVTIMVLHFALL